MDIIFDFIFELLFESMLLIINNNKISKIIRYPIIFIFISFYLVLELLILYIGIISIKSGGIYIFLGLLMIFISIILVVCFIKKVIKKENNF